MRYMGAMAAAVDPTLGAQAMTAAIDALPEDQATQFLDAVDASKEGHSRMVMRYAVGGAAGLAAGFLVCKLLKK